MRTHSLGLVLLLLTAACKPEISYGGRQPDLSGTVLVDGRPAAGVTMHATVGSDTYTTQTGPSGSYAFVQIRFGVVTVRAETPLVVFDPASQEAKLGEGDVELNFQGYGPAAVSGDVIWEYAHDGASVGMANVPVRLDAPGFPVGDIATGIDGSFRIPRAPGHGSFSVMFGALPPGLVYHNGDRATYYAPASSPEATRKTAYVEYRPSGSVRVEVVVDGVGYNDIPVRLNTPFPVMHRPGLFINLPQQALEISLVDPPAFISFDSVVKHVQLGPSNSYTVVTFVGWTPVANRPPTVSIQAPATGATFTRGTPITLRAVAHDFEEGNLTGNALRWLISGVGDLGYGASLTVDTLAVGQHRIGIFATDSRGLWGAASIDITIVPATGGRVVGTLMVDGGPSSGTRINLSTSPARSVLTDVQGAYAFEDVPAGAYVVSVESSICVAYTPESQAVSVAIGGRTTVNFTGVGSTPCYDYGGYGPGRSSARSKRLSPPAGARGRGGQPLTGGPQSSEAYHPNR